MDKIQFDAITNWQDQTFTDATALSKVHHLKQEVEELQKSIETTYAETNEEIADCFILLAGIAHKCGLTYYDLCKEIDQKMITNLSRKWGSPDENGVVNHIKE